MKKYLMMGAAALMIGASFTSCSKDTDLYDPEGNAQRFLESYANAFIRVFGQPAANQTWGFGTSASARATRALGDYNSYKGSVTPQEFYQDENWQWQIRPYYFPSAPEASYYLTDKGDATYYDGSAQIILDGNSIYLDENVGDNIDIKGHGTVFVVKSNADQENVEINKKWYVGNVTYSQENLYKIRVYVGSGVTFKIPTADAQNFQNNVEYYLAPGSKLTCDTYIKLNSTKLFVAAGASVEVPAIELNGTCEVYNQGDITTTGFIYVANANSIFVNDGTITQGTANNPNALLQTAGSGRVQNNAEWTIYGTVILDSNYNIWVNNGHFTTTNFCYTAGSNSVINNCFLEVTNEFDINLGGGAGAAGGFTNGAGAGVLTQYFNGGGNFNLTYTAVDGNPATKSHNGGPFEILMHSNSVFKVTETATMTGRNENNGFFGIGDDYAVLVAKDIVAGADDQGLVTYRGNIYVSAESHFANFEKGQYSAIYYEDGHIFAPGFTEGAPSIENITENLCRPGFSRGTTPDDPVTPDDPTDPVADYRVICEDLTASEKTDFDFNDVVFDVYYTSDNTANIKIVAAGGTLPLTVNGVTSSDAVAQSQNEVHSLFGVNVTDMVNTGAGPSKPAVTLENVTINKNLDDDGIQIWVNKGTADEPVWCKITAFVAEPAAKIKVSHEFQFCSERQDMKTKFQKFAKYVQNPAVKWYDAKGAPIADDAE